MKTAIRIVWIILSLVVLVLLVIPHLLDPSQMIGLTPACSSMKHHGVPCIFCGMTRAFTEVSQGHFFEAYTLNYRIAFVYPTLIINSLFFTYYILKLTIKPRKKHI